MNCVLSHLPGRRVPEGLAAIVVKAMAPEMELRYQTVAELQADILSWQGGFAPKAERAGIGRQMILWAGRHKGPAEHVPRGIRPLTQARARPCPRE